MVPDETGEEVTPVDALLQKHGVDSLEALDKKLAEMQIPNRAFAEMRNENKALREQMEAREQELAELRDGLGSGNDDATVREIRNLKRELKVLQERVLVTPEDKELEPFMQQAMDKFPSLTKLPSVAERLEATRSIARGLRAETNSAGNQRSDTGSRPETISATYVERGGGIVAGGSVRSSDEQDLAKYQEERHNAPDRDSAAAIDAKYRKKHPDWGI